MAAAERADLLAQIGTAQTELDQLLSQLGSGAGTALIEAQAQRHLLAQIERRLASGLASSESVRNEVANVIANASNLAQQVRTMNDHRGSLELATAQARTRATVTEIGRDIYERRIFDPYLRFEPAEDEAAYRDREADNRRAIADALAQGTPEGDLRAAELIRRQLADAGEHGADAAPQFADRMARINRDIAGLEQAIASQQRRPESERGNTRPLPSPPSPAPASDEELASVLATFRAAGIAGGTTAEQSGHGLNVSATAPSRSQNALG